MATIKVSTPSQIIAAVPHLLGFQPIDSFVVFSTGNPAPTARIDHPHDGADLLDAAATLGAAYRNNPGGKAVLLAFTDDRTHAIDAITAITAILDGITDVVDALIVDGIEWSRVDGTGGLLDPAAVDQINAAFVLEGKAMPQPHRESLAAHLNSGDPTGVDDALGPVFLDYQRLVGEHGPEEAANHETQWVTQRITQFNEDQVTLSDQDAARLLFAITRIPCRDAAWALMHRKDAATSVALWTDLTRRAPKDVQTPAAALLAFAAWLAGQGALAWTALDLIPKDANYTLADLVAHAVESALNPNTWQGLPHRENA